MRKLRIFVLGTFLLSTLAATGLASAMDQMEEMEEAKTCGAWEQIHGTTDFRRGCSEGSLYWYEYRSMLPK